MAVAQAYYWKFVLILYSINQYMLTDLMDDETKLQTHYHAALAIQLGPLSGVWLVGSKNVCSNGGNT